MTRKLILATAALLTLLIAGFFIVGCGYEWKTKSFFNQMQQATTPTQVQTWALEEIARAGGDDVELDSRPSFLELPDDGLPNYIYVESTDDEQYLVAQWGSGFGHWGILVGDPTLKYPIDDFYHIEWAPGVYVWHEIQ